jgi:predicted SnoaL-like aldol condensation-catalyzing enzyme
VTQTIEEKNKAFVLEAFDTLFNKRDYAAAERFWSPNYIQHSAHIPPGREGLFALIKGPLKLCTTRTGLPLPMATTCSSTAGLAA